MRNFFDQGATSQQTSQQIGFPAAQSAGSPPGGLSKGGGEDDDIPTPPPIWWITKDGDDYCRELFDRHYSRRRYADGRDPKLFVGPGEKLVLRTWECDALWVWRKFIDDSPLGGGVNCAIFRNESRHRSSDLIRQADRIADLCWPGERHYTFVDAEKVASTNPGYCFKRAGWKTCGRTKSGKIVLERYPPPTTHYLSP